MGDIYTNPPQSRNEAILRATIDGTEYTDPPQSRIEDLLIQLKEVIEHGEAKIKIGDVQGATASTSLRTATLTWSDPSDLELDGVILAKWAGTKVVRKAGSAPADNTDGTVVIDNTTRDAYSETGLVDSDLEYGTTYYYRFFPYTDDGLVTDGSSVSATPEKITIASVPTQSGSLTYNGTEQTATFSGYDTDQMTATGITGTNAGTYTASFTPKSDYMWWDGTETAKTASWTISKATNTITASPSSISLDTTTLYQDVTLTQTGDGVLSVVSGDTDVVTVGAIENGVFRATGIDTGNTTITVSSTATENFEAGTLEIACVVLFIVSWATGTDEQIAAAIAAADRGEIDLYADYGWRVGDERDVQLSAMDASGTFDGVSWTVGESHVAQTVTLVLMDGGTTSETGNTFTGTAASDVYTFVTSVKNKDGTTRTNPSFIVGMKDYLTKNASREGGYVNSSPTSEGSWNGCSRRNWCNGAFRGSFSSTLRPIFKKFNCITAKTYNGSTNQTSQDYFALHAEREVYNSRSMSNQTEYNALKQLEYYKTQSNRIKKARGGSSADSWWERSPSTSGIREYCDAGSSGYPGAFEATTSLGLAPFGCI